MKKRKLPSGVFERPDSPGVWYIRWTDNAGKWKRAATTADNPRDAARILSELLAKNERQRLGLEATPIQRTAKGTLWELCEWWLAKKCSVNSLGRETSRLQYHVRDTVLGTTPLAHDIEDAAAKYFDTMEEGGAAPASINKLRSTLISVFNEAAKPPRRWTGRNPVTGVQVRRVLKPTYNTVTSEEIEPMLRWVNEAWAGFFATGIYLGFRKGEIAGLLKANVDLEKEQVLVKHSYDFDTTKGGHEDWLPIPSPLLPYFREAMGSPGPWMFPNLTTDSSGMTRHTEDSDPEKRLRTALKRAGIVTGYVHHCRRCGHARRPRGAGRKSLREGAKLKDPEPSPFPKYSKEHPDDSARRCPQCNMALWAEGIPRVRRFQDLRHSTVTILLRRGVNPHKVQRIARHSKLETTLGIYGHLDVDDLRGAAEMIASPAATVTNLVVKSDPNPSQLKLVEKKAGPTGGISQ